MGVSIGAYEEIILQVPGGRVLWQPMATPHCLLIGEDRVKRARAITAAVAELQTAGWKALYSGNAEDAAVDIRAAYDLMVDRYARIEDGRDSDPEMTPLILAVNDYQDFTGDLDLATIISYGRAARVHLILGTSRSLFDDALPSFGYPFVHVHLDDILALAGAGR